jgi:hypothetical protein
MPSVSWRWLQALLALGLLVNVVWYIGSLDRQIHSLENSNAVCSSAFMEATQQLICFQDKILLGSTTAACDTVNAVHVTVPNE